MAASAPVLFEDESSVLPLFQALRDNELSVAWIAIVEKDESHGTLNMKVAAHGAGGVESYRSHLGASEAVYVVVSIPHLEGPHAVYKHMLVSYVGPEATPLVRARSSVTRGRLYARVDALVVLHGELQALEPGEISDDLLAQKMTGSKHESAVESGEGKRVVKASAGGAPKPFEFEDGASVRGAVEAIRTRESAANWLLLGYKASEDGAVGVLAQGNGGLEEIVPLLKDSEVAYFVLGIQPEDEKTRGGDFTQTKHILVTWVGTGCEPIHKARSSQHRNELYQFTKKIMQLHGEFQVLHPSELTEQLLKEKLTLSKVREEDSLLRAAEQDRLKKLALEQKRNQPLHNFSGFAGAPSGVSANPARSTTPSSAGSGSRSGAPSSAAPAVQSPFRGDNETAAVTALQAIADGGSSTNWIVFGYEANKVNLRIEASGEGTLESFTGTHFVANTVCYALYGVPIDEGDYSTIKYLLISFVDPDVTPLHKARSSQHRVTLYNYVNQFLQLAGEFHCLDRVINRELLLQKLAGSSTVDVGDADSAMKAALKTRSTRAGSSSPAAGSSSSSGGASGYVFEGEEASIELLKRIQRPDADFNYILFHHPQGPGKNVIGVAGQGNGGAEELVPLLKDDQIAYAILVYRFVEHDDASGNYGTRKNLFISWVGTDVPPLAKARSSQHRVVLERWIKLHLQLHGTLHAINQADMSDDLIKERLKK